MGLVSPESGSYPVQSEKSQDGSVRERPSNLSTLWLKQRGTCTLRQGQRSVVEPGWKWGEPNMECDGPGGG